MTLNAQEQNFHLQKQERLIRLRVPSQSENLIIPKIDSEFDRPLTSQNQWINSPEKDEINDKPLGLDHVFNKHHSVAYKTFWSIFITCNICVCVYQISDRLAYFLDTPIRTIINIEQQQRAEFPSFTLCPYSGQYPKLKVVQLEIISKTLKNFSDYCDVTFYEIIRFSDSNLTELWQNASLSDEIRKIAIRDNNVYSLNSPFRKNSFNWNKSIKRIDVQNTLGTCQMFVMPKVPIEHNIWRVFFEVYYTSPCKEIIYMALHAEEDFPNIYYVMDPHYYFRWTSQLYQISIQKFFRQSTYKNPCGNKFDVSKCRKNCYYKILRQRLHCKTPNMPYMDIPLCNNSKDAYEVYFQEYSVQTEFDFIINCSKCKIKCEEIMYSMNLLHNDKRSNVSDKLALSYSIENNLVVVVTEEYAYTVVSLFCEIGGNLGLFLGLCLISMFEIFENAALKAIGYFGYKLSRKN